jgi:hypothetical protein
MACRPGILGRVHGHIRRILILFVVRHPPQLATRAAIISPVLRIFAVTRGSRYIPAAPAFHVAGVRIFATFG